MGKADVLQNQFELLVFRVILRGANFKQAWVEEPKGLRGGYWDHDKAGLNEDFYFYFFSFLNGFCELLLCFVLNFIDFFDGSIFEFFILNRDVGDFCNELEKTGMEVELG